MRNILFCKLEHTGMQNSLLCKLEHTGMRNILFCNLERTGMRTILFYKLERTGMRTILFCKLERTGMRTILFCKLERTGMRNIRFAKYESSCTTVSEDKILFSGSDRIFRNFCRNFKSLNCDLLKVAKTEVELRLNQFRMQNTHFSCKKKFFHISFFLK